MSILQFLRIYLLVMVTVITTASAQMMPEAPASKAPATSNTGDAAREQPPAVATLPLQSDDTFTRYWHRFMGEQSPYRPIILSVITLLVLLKLKGATTKRMRKYVNDNALVKENSDVFMRVWNYAWFFATAVLVVIAMSGSIKVLGLTAGFIGMILGWSLQQPVTGIAAWLMIVLKKPFRIGDRVIIAGITGDVTGITLTHVILNQVGGSISGEERSGRGILIPNAILFQQTIINYTLEQKFMLDEVPVRLTFDCDWEEAKKLMLQAAREETKDLVEDSGTEPFIRVELLDWGLLARLRYNTIPSSRQETSSKVIENLLGKFKAAYPRVKFALPSSRVRYTSDDGERSPEETKFPVET